MSCDATRLDPGARGGMIGGIGLVHHPGCPQMALTDTQIRRAKPREKAHRLYDGRGLYLEVSPSGGRRTKLPRPVVCSRTCCSWRQIRA